MLMVLLIITAFLCRIKKEILVVLRHEKQCIIDLALTSNNWIFCFSSFMIWIFECAVAFTLMLSCIIDWLDFYELSSYSIFLTILLFLVILTYFFFINFMAIFFFLILSFLKSVMFTQILLSVILFFLLLLRLNFFIIRIKVSFRKVYFRVRASFSEPAEVLTLILIYSVILCHSILCWS